MSDLERLRKILDPLPGLLRRFDAAITTWGERGADEAEVYANGQGRPVERTRGHEEDERE